MSRRRRNFTMALVLFLAWVGVLAMMAGFSGDRPQSAGPGQSAR